MPVTSVYQLHVSLLNSDPLIWRRFLLPPNARLSRLHQVLQIVMGWENCHAHEFRSRGVRYGTPEFDEPGFPRLHDETAVPLCNLLRVAGDKLSYEYDLGDSWEHEILLEHIKAVDPSVTYPVCITGQRACPPEDSGGLPGFYHYLEVLANPAHEEHHELLNWRGPGYDPESFDVARINALLQRRSRGLRAGPA
jgi:Plasmid pRiA4b ORF-3-like protein